MRNDLPLFSQRRGCEGQERPEEGFDERGAVSNRKEKWPFHCRAKLIKSLPWFVDIEAVGSYK